MKEVRNDLRQAVCVGKERGEGKENASVQIPHMRKKGTKKKKGRKANGRKGHEYLKFLPTHFSR